MRRRDVGLILMVIGVLCGLAFGLLNLSGSFNTRLGNLVLYAGIIALAIGLVIFITTSSGSEKKGNRR